MKRFAVIIVGFGFLGVGTGCKPQPGALASANGNTTSAFTQLPASTAEPVKTSLPSLASFKSLGDLTVPFYNDNPGGPVFSPDGKWLAAPGTGWSRDGLAGDTNFGALVFLWDVKTRVLVEKLETSREYLGPLNHLVWSPDGKQVAAWLIGQNSSSPLFVWNVASGAHYSIPSEKLTVSSAFFSREGQVTATWFDYLESASGTDNYVSVGRKNKRKLVLGNRIINMLVPRKKNHLWLLCSPKATKWHRASL